MIRALIELGVEYNSNYPPVRVIATVELERYGRLIRQRKVDPFGVSRIMPDMLHTVLLKADYAEVFEHAIVIVDLTNVVLIKNHYAFDPRSLPNYCNDFRTTAELVSPAELLERIKSCRPS